jgi:GT2 family glycosyltransferase
MKLSVVVLTYEAGELLLRCLESVFASQVPFAWEVILVDNRSTDGSVERVVERFGDRLAEVVRNPRNGGFAYGHNAGLRLSRGEYVCLLNPDTTVRPDALAALVAFLDANPGVGFAGPRVLNPDGTDQRSAMRMIPSPADAAARALMLSRLFPKSRRLARFHAAGLDPAQPHRVEACTGCCMVARRAMLEGIGPLDERFFLYCEDVDWFLRARAAGWSVHYRPEAVIEHRNAYSRRRRRFRAVFDAHWSMILFHEKHFARGYPAPVNAALYGGVLARMGLLMAHGAVTGWR